MMNISKICRPSVKSATIILCCVFAVVILALFVSKSSNPALGEMPYGVKWGMTYEQVAKKVPDIDEPVLNSNGTSYISMPYLDGPFDGFEKIDMSVAISYNFGLNDSLETITEFVYLYDEETVSANTIMNDMVMLLYKQYGDYQQNSYYAECTWNTDYGTIRITLMSDTCIVISIKPN